MKIGDNVQLKEDYNVSVSYGNVGFRFAGGSKAVILQVQEGSTVVSAGFHINETVTVTALVDRDVFDIVS